jgi:hypothetical protein
MGRPLLVLALSNHAVTSSYAQSLNVAPYCPVKNDPNEGDRYEYPRSVCQPGNRPTQEVLDVPKY